MKLVSFLFAALLVSCSKPQVPQHAQQIAESAPTQPQWDDAVLPPNIAPLNFRLAVSADGMVVDVYAAHAGKTHLVVEGTETNFPIKQWRQVLSEAVGDTLCTDVYALHKGQWTRYATRRNAVNKDSLDPFVAYRLIEPSYVDYEQMFICERRVDNFDERVLVDNMQLTQGDNGACVNCHSVQNYNRSGRFQMHIRQNHGGTLLANGTQTEKVNLKTDSTLSAGVYPAWHPTLPFVAYSVNETGQVFHTRDVQKVEVQDYASDLIIYDIEQHEVRSLGRTASDFETFPTWSPDGQTLYYASAHFDVAEQGEIFFRDNYQELRYNILRRQFDVSTHTFSLPDTVFNASALGLSAVQPRISPDGRWLLVSVAPYGQFHVWHNESDLWVVDLQSLQARPLSLANALGQSDSFHGWSSNGRWIVFASRRLDGNYTRLFFSHFNPTTGEASPALLLPQRSATYYDDFHKSYNVPEWLCNPIQASKRQLYAGAIKEARPATYGGSALRDEKTEETTVISGSLTADSRAEKIDY